MKLVPALLLCLAAACGKGERAGLTADSAVLQSGAPAGDSAAVIGGSADSAVGDSLSVDSIALHEPTVVLVTDSAAGDALFRRKGKCLSCHGFAGAGLNGLGPDLRDSVWLHGNGSFAFIRRVIMDGIARPKVAGVTMPAFGPTTNADAPAAATTLSPDEIYHIAAYVYTLSHPGSAVADTTRAVIDSTGAPPDSSGPPIPPPAHAGGSTTGERRPALPFRR